MAWDVVDLGIVDLGFSGVSSVAIQNISRFDQRFVADFCEPLAVGMELPTTMKLTKANKFEG